jgi:hypothetical protein
MAWHGVEERRRMPRLDMSERCDCQFDMRARVKLVDISASGALLVSDIVLPVETTGQLKAVLGASPFTPSVQVRRTSALAGNEGTQLGTVFVGMDDESRKSLEAFLRKATS